MEEKKIVSVNELKDICEKQNNLWILLRNAEIVAASFRGKFESIDDVDHYENFLSLLNRCADDASDVAADIDEAISEIE